MQDWVIKSRSFPVEPSRAVSPAGGPELKATALDGKAIGGGEVVAAIERWLGSRRGQAEDRTQEIDRVLGALRDAVATIVASPVLRDDAGAARLIERLARAETIEDFDAALTALAGRVSELNGQGGSPAPVRTVEARRPVRTLLKL